MRNARAASVILAALLAAGCVGEPPPPGTPTYDLSERLSGETAGDLANGNEAPPANGTTETSPPEPAPEAPPTNETLPETPENATAEATAGNATEAPAIPPANATAPAANDTIEPPNGTGLPESATDLPHATLWNAATRIAFPPSARAIAARVELAAGDWNASASEPRAHLRVDVESAGATGLLLYELAQGRFIPRGALLSGAGGSFAFRLTTPVARAASLVVVVAAPDGAGAARFWLADEATATLPAREREAAPNASGADAAVSFLVASAPAGYAVSRGTEVEDTRGASPSPEGETGAYRATVAHEIASRGVHEAWALHDATGSAGTWAVTRGLDGEEELRGGPYVQRADGPSPLAARPHALSRGALAEEAYALIEVKPDGPALPLVALALASASIDADALGAAFPGEFHLNAGLTPLGIRSEAGWVIVDAGGVAFAGASAAIRIPI